MSIMTENTIRYIKTKKTFMSIMTEKNKLTRPPEIDKELHKEIRVYAIKNDYNTREAYERLLRSGLEKEKKRGKNE